MNRGSFLKSLGLGLATAATPSILSAQEKKSVKLRVNLPPEAIEFRTWARSRCKTEFVERNEKGIIYERNKQIDKAIQVYEQNINDRAWGDHPYKRLFVIYKKQGNYIDAKRVANAYLKLEEEFQIVKNAKNPNFKPLLINKKRNYFLDGLAKLK